MKPPKSCAHEHDSSRWSPTRIVSIFLGLFAILLMGLYIGFTFFGGGSPVGLFPVLGGTVGLGLASGYFWRNASDTMFEAVVRAVAERIKN